MKLIPKKGAPRRRPPVLRDFEGRVFTQTLLPLSVSATLPPTAQTQTPPTPDEGTTAHPSRGDGASINGQVVTQVWIELSRYPDEGSLAGKRWLQCVDGASFDELELLQAISEHAVEGHHAAAITAEKMRWRIGRMRETLRDEQKSDERLDSLRIDRGLRPASAAIDVVLRRLGIR